MQADPERICALIPQDREDSLAGMVKNVSAFLQPELRASSFGFVQSKLSLMLKRISRTRPKIIPVA